MDNNNYSDLINLIGLIIGVMNLEENLTQNDKQDLIDNFNNEIHNLLKEVHTHLEKQDRKIDKILSLLENKS